MFLKICYRSCGGSGFAMLLIAESDTELLLLTERRGRYSLEYFEKLYIIENVPAHVNDETGEQYFSPKTVEQLHKTIKGTVSPRQVVETPVFDYPE